jgi:hypothetical protein
VLLKAECTLKIDTKKMVGKYCLKLAICLRPVGATIGFALVISILEDKVLKTAAEVGANTIGLVFTGPVMG